MAIDLILWETVLRELEKAEIDGNFKALRSAIYASMADLSNKSPLAGPGLTQPFTAKSLALANIRDNTPNVLDWVEKGGTFTPSLKFSGGSTGMAYSLQKGYYTRIADIMIALVNITLTAKGSATGFATMTGMPMAAASSGMSGMLIGATGMVSQAPFAYAGISGTTLYLRKQSATGYTDLSDADFSSTSQINTTIIYLV